MKNVFDYILGNSYIKVNLDIVGAFGLTEAYILTYLLNKQAYWLAEGKLSVDGFFYATAADVESFLRITGRVQTTAIKNLEAAGIIETKLKGTPNNTPARHFKILPQAEAIISKAIGFNIGAVGVKSHATVQATNKNAIYRNAKCNLQKRKMQFTETQNTIYKTANNIDNIYIDNIDKEEDKSSSIYSENLPFENLELSTANPYADFDAEAQAKGFEHILKIAIRFEKEKVAEKRKIFGDADFWAVLQDIEDYIANNPKKKKYSELPRAFNTFTGGVETYIANKAFNAYWQHKFGFAHNFITKLSSGERIALKSIFSRIKTAMQEKGKETSNEAIEGAILHFFKSLPERWANPQYFKLANIANDFPAILAAIKNPTAAIPQAQKARQQIEDEYIEKRNAERAADRQAQSWADAMLDTLKGMQEKNALDNIPEEWKTHPVCINFLTALNAQPDNLSW